MEERALLAIIISIMIIVLFQYFFVPKQKIRNKELEKKEAITEKKEEKKVFPEEEEEVEEESFSKLKEYQKKLKEETITVETEKYIAKVTNNGGCITSWKLKDYFKEESYETWPLKKDFWTQVKESYKGIFRKNYKKIEHKQIVDLVPDIEDDIKAPLDIKLLSEIGGTENFGEGIYSHNIVYFDSNNNNKRIKSLKMSFLDDRNIMIEKETRFYKEGYKFDLEIKLRNESKRNQKIDYALFWGPGIGKEKNLPACPALRYRYA